MMKNGKPLVDVGSRYNQYKEAWTIDGTEFTPIHRTDGPAIVYFNDEQLWFINNVSYTTNESYRVQAELSNEEMSFIVLKYGNVE